MRTCLLCESTSAGTAVRFPNQHSAICTWCRDELKRTGRAWCAPCRSAYPLAEMTDQGRVCKKCKSVRNRAYRTTHIEQVRRYRQAYYAKAPHSGKLTREQRQAHYTRHHARNIERMREWRAKNKEHIRAYNKAYKELRLTENPNYWKDQRQKKKLAMIRRVFGS